MEDKGTYKWRQEMEKGSREAEEEVQIDTTCATLDCYFHNRIQCVRIGLLP